jgi:TPR repeat protein
MSKWGGASVESVRQAAEGGDASAQHYLGYCYTEGFRVSADPASAVRWYERAGTSGYLPAWNNLGLIYQRGKGVPKDLPKAIEYYRRAADGGLPRAQANLGFLYLDGVGVPRDAAEAFRWFQLSADNGLTAGMVEVGRRYRFGQGVAQDFQKAAIWFKKAAEKGDSLGEFNLGLLYQSQGQQQEAVSSLHRAAEHGQFDAMVSLYFAYLRGEGLDADRSEALKWLTKAAEGGNAYAECLLGYEYENPRWEHTPTGDRLVPPNMTEAVRWYRRSSEHEWAGGQYHLGLCYLVGIGVPQGEEQGLELIRKAADQNQAYAIAELAHLYASGIGRPRDEHDQPIQLLKKVLEAKPEGDRSVISEAYESLILRYERGVGTDPDLLAAVEYQCRAALAGMGNYSLAEPRMEASARSRIMGSYTGEPGRSIIAVTIPDCLGRTSAFTEMLSLYLRAAKGDYLAATQIGRDYLTGQDVPTSRVKAWLWLTLAGGDPASKSLLVDCQAGMSPEELQQAHLQWPTFRQHLAEVGQQASLASEPTRR